MKIYQDSVDYYYRQGDKARSLQYRVLLAEAMEQVSPQPDLRTRTNQYLKISSAAQELEDWQTALEADLKVVALMEQSLGLQSIQLASYYYGAAKRYRLLGNHARALEYELRILDIRKTQLGSEHVDIGTSCLAIADEYVALKDYLKALPYAQRALAVFEKTLPQGHDIRTRALTLVGTLKGYTDNPAGAVADMEQALNMARQQYPDDPTRWAPYLQNLVYLYNNHTGQFDKALAAQRQIVQIAEQQQPRQPIVLATAYYALGNILQNRRDRQEAAAAYDKALALIDAGALVPPSLAEDCRRQRAAVK